MIRAVWAVLAGAFLAAALLTPPVYALFALGLIGFVLCASLERSDSPWRCVGLHVGWFLAAELAVYATVPPADAPSELPVRFLALGLPWTLGAVAAVGWLEVRRTPRAQPAATP